MKEGRGGSTTCGLPRPVRSDRGVRPFGVDAAISVRDPQVGVGSALSGTGDGFAPVDGAVPPTTRVAPALD